MPAGAPRPLLHISRHTRHARSTTPHSACPACARSLASAACTARSRIALRLSSMPPPELPAPVELPVEPIFWPAPLKACVDFFAMCDVLVAAGSPPTVLLVRSCFGSKHATQLPRKAARFTQPGCASPSSVR